MESELFVNANQQFIECTLHQRLIFGTEDGAHHPVQNREHASDHAMHRLVHCGGEPKSAKRIGNRDMSASRY